jgi:hypothetical protein
MFVCKSEVRKKERKRSCYLTARITVSYVEKYWIGIYFYPKANIIWVLIQQLQKKAQKLAPSENARQLWHRLSTNRKTSAIMTVLIPYICHAAIEVIRRREGE